MAEPYVPIAQLTTQQALMTELEVTTVAASPYATDLDDAVDLALSSKNTAQNLAEENFNMFMFGGA
jgi:hypothetical protein